MAQLTTEDYAIVGRNVRRGIRISDHHDHIDYRAMLVRAQGRDVPFFKNGAVLTEIITNEPFRVTWERRNGVVS